MKRSGIIILVALLVATGILAIVAAGTMRESRKMVGGETVGVNKERYGEIGSVGYKKTGNRLRIWNSEENTAIRDPIISADNGSIRLYELDGVHVADNHEDNIIRLKGDLIGNRPPKDMYENYPYYTEVVVVVENAARVTVDDLWGENMIAGGEGMEEAVINLSE